MWRTAGFPPSAIISVLWNDVAFGAKDGSYDIDVKSVYEYDQQETVNVKKCRELLIWWLMKSYARNILNNCVTVTRQKKNAFCHFPMFKINSKSNNTGHCCYRCWSCCHLVASFEFMLLSDYPNVIKWFAKPKTYGPSSCV